MKPVSQDNLVSNTELEYVGFGARSTAWTIDSLLLLMLMLPITWMFGLENIADTDALSIIGKWLLPAVPTIYCWAVYQATPGKMFIRARIVDADTGGNATRRQLLVRYLGYFPSTLVFGLGFLWVAFDDRKQGWHDKLSGTVVVRNRTHGVAAHFFADRQA